MFIAVISFSSFCGLWCHDPLKCENRHAVLGSVTSSHRQGKVELHYRSQFWEPGHGVSVPWNVGLKLKLRKAGNVDCLWLEGENKGIHKMNSLSWILLQVFHSDTSFGACWNVMKYKITDWKGGEWRIKKNEYFDLCPFWRASSWQIPSYLIMCVYYVAVHISGLRRLCVEICATWIINLWLSGREKKRNKVNVWKE